MSTRLMERPRSETTYQNFDFDGMVDGMTTKKYTVTLPEDLAEEIRAAVGPGRFSAYVADTLERRRENERLGELVDYLEDEYGPVTDEQMAAARKRREDIRRRHTERRARLRNQGYEVSE